MRVILAPDPRVWKDGRKIPPDQPADLDADLATRLLAQGTAIATSDAPWVLVVRSVKIGEGVKPVGWRGQVSPATANFVVRREFGLRLPPPPDGNDDPLFPGLGLDTLPPHWSGRFSELYRLLCLEAPIVKAFEMPAEDVRPEPLRGAEIKPARYQCDWIKARLNSAPNGIQDSGAQLRAKLQTFNQPDDPWTRSVVIAGYRQLGISVATDGQHTDYTRLALREALCWWRNLAADALLTELLDMVRCGHWSLEAIRADDPQRGLSRLPGSWLSDPKMVLSLRSDELRPIRRETAGLPWFRNLRIVTGRAREDEQPVRSDAGGQAPVLTESVGGSAPSASEFPAEHLLAPVPTPDSSSQQQPPEPAPPKPVAYRKAKFVPDLELLDIALEQLAEVERFPDRSVDEWHDDAQRRENQRAKDAKRVARKVAGAAFERVNMPLIDAALPEGHTRTRGRKRSDAKR